MVVQAFLLQKFNLHSIITFMLQIKKEEPLVKELVQGYTTGLFKILWMSVKQRLLYKELILVLHH